MPFKNLADAKVYRKSYHLSHRKEHNAKRKQYRINNKQKELARARKYRKDNKERISVWKREYRKTHQSAIKEYKRKRRALKSLVSEHFTAADEKYILDLFHHRCFICGSTDDITIDHVYPLSAGFALTRQNACVLCKYHNCVKSNKMPEDFYSTKILKILLKMLGATSSASCSSLNSNYAYNGALSQPQAE